MSERPILFSGPMVEAILAGRKTQTRRILKPQPVIRKIDGGHDVNGLPVFMGGQAYAVGQAVECGVLKPRWQVGDRLWVREAHAIIPATAYRHDPTTPHRVSPDGDWWAVYREGWDRSRPGQWKPSIHMPRWACRLELDVARIHVERLQDISEADALAEGVKASDAAAMFQRTETGYRRAPELEGTARGAFAVLWDQINCARGYGWGSNPWVWVIEFQRYSARNTEGGVA